MDVPERALPTAHYTGVPQEIREKNTIKNGPDAVRTAQNSAETARPFMEVRMVKGGLMPFTCEHARAPKRSKLGA